MNEVLPLTIQRTAQHYGAHCDSNYGMSERAVLTLD